MQTNSPPKRPCTPDRDRKYERRYEGCQQADRGLPPMGGVEQHEQNGQDNGAGPEAQKGASWGREDLSVHAGEAAGERVKHKAASQRFFEDADHEENEAPSQSIADCACSRKKT